MNTGDSCFIFAPDSLHRAWYAAPEELPGPYYILRMTVLFVKAKVAKFSKKIHRRAAESAKGWHARSYRGMAAWSVERGAWCVEREAWSGSQKTEVRRQKLEDRIEACGTRVLPQRGRLGQPGVERGAGCGVRGAGLSVRPEWPGWGSQGWSEAQPLVRCPPMRPKPQRGGLSE